MEDFGICCIIKPRKLCSEDCIASCCQKGTNWLISQKTGTYFFWFEWKQEKLSDNVIISTESHDIFKSQTNLRSKKNNNLKVSLKLAQSNCAKFSFFGTDYIGLEHLKFIFERQLKLDAGYEMHCIVVIILVYRTLSKLEACRRYAFNCF